MNGTGAKRWRTVVIEDQTLLRELLAYAIRSWSDRFELVAEADTGSQGLECCLRLHPELVVLDLNLHDTDAVELARRLHRSGRHCRILALSNSREPVLLNRIREVGVPGIIEMDQPIEILEEAMAEVASGRRYVPAALSQTQQGLRDDPDAFPRFLSGREQDVLRLVAQGHTSKTIARQLDLSPRSVETFRYRLMRKLGVRNTAGLMDFAFRKGLVLTPHPRLSPGSCD